MGFYSSNKRSNTVQIPTGVVGGDGGAGGLAGGGEGGTGDESDTVESQPNSQVNIVRQTGKVRIHFPTWGRGLEKTD